MCKHSFGSICNWSPSRRHYSYDPLGFNHRDVVTRRMIQGFNDACKEAGTRVTGGQTVFNPWPIICGCATTTLAEKIAANLALWLGDPKKWQKAGMMRLNRHASNLAAVQKASVSLEIHLLPIIEGLAVLESGSTPTTSSRQAFLPRPPADGPEADAWIGGQVVEGDRTARLSENCRILEV
eukprot:s7878_g2.t1